MRNKLFVLASVVMIASMLLSACATPTTPAPGQTLAPVQPGITEIVNTVVVTSPPQTTVQVVTATPLPAAPLKTFKSKDPTTIVSATIGDMVTMDPAQAYDTASGEIIQNTYETLIFFNRESASSFVPMLATEVPSAANGGISADGKTITFKIRQGVKFHNGDPMTATDVAYSFIRGLLQSGPNSPEWILTEPFFGIGMQDASMIVEAVKAGAKVGDTLTAAQIAKATGTALNGDTAGMAKVDPKVLKTTCDWVTSLIVPDDTKGTVTMKLSQPWGPFLPAIANTWGAVMDKKWVASNKGWSGSCDDWVKFYGVTESDPFNGIENGTGPYKLAKWTQGTEIDLEAFTGYWMKDPMWKGAPTGDAAVKHIVIKEISEWGTRFSMLQAGDADLAAVPRANVSQVDPLVGEQANYDLAKGDFGPVAPSKTPDQPLRLAKGAPALAEDTLMFNFAINTQGGNPYIGSGKLDGKGIPATFFSDVNVRKGFEYCFNWDTMISQFWLGEAIQSFTLPLPGMPGYDAAGPHYTFDATKCTDAFKASTLKAADGKSLWDTGFTFQLTYNTGNTSRLTVANILQSNLAKVNNKFIIQVLGVPWPTILSEYQHARLPAFIIGWQEDYHDPHDWYQPFLVGTYGSNQNFPADLVKTFIQGVNAGVSETDPAKRDTIYKGINKVIYDQATMILLPLGTGRHYEQRWVKGYYYNPLYGGFYYYTLSKD
jgi:peptide/nickel transport system substrate-binding protein